jgi:hypothetical protein
MSEKERFEAAEQALYQSWKHFRALRSVGFILGETQGGGPSEWSGQPIEDLAALVDVLAQHGVDHADAGLEELQGIRMDRIKTA